MSNFGSVRFALGDFLRGLRNAFRLDPNRVTVGQLSVGDVVSLRSGGPKMVVEKLDGHLVTCAWFRKQGDLMRQPFDVRLLQLGQSRFVIVDPLSVTQNIAHFGSHEPHKRGTKS